MSHFKQVNRPNKKAIRKLFQLKLNYNIFYGDAHHYHSRNAFDLAYLDFCGQIDESMLLWLASLQFTPNAVVGITLSYCDRSFSTFYKSLLDGRYDSLTKKPIFSRGFHQSDTKIHKICSILAGFLPGIKFNITHKYSDTRATMMFIGGFFGHVRRVKKVTSYFERVCEKDV